MKVNNIRESVENITTEDVVDTAKTVAVATLTVTCKTIGCLCSSLLDVITNSNDKERSRKERRNKK